ncbi:MAG: transporter [Proteobacteria bacterium]|nr:transporter [Pseudomonadota bacterium]
MSGQGYFLNRLCQFVLFTALLCGALFSHVAGAQDLEPRSYTNIPVGESFLVVGYIRSGGEIAPSGTSSPIQDFELDIDAGVIGFAHSFGLAGKSAKIDMGATRQCWEGSATYRGEFVADRRCGYGDPKIRLSWNFYGAPALALEEFMTWEPGLVIGTSLQVSVPVGTYKDDQLVNFGANRWMFRPGIGMSHKFGRWHYDVIASVRLYEDNDDFFNGSTVEQDPLYSVQGHLIYNLRKGRWLSLNANFYRGGETSVEHIPSRNLKENSRFGMTYSTPINRHNSLKLYASTGVLTRTGDDFDTFGIAWQYRF